MTSLHVVFVDSTEQANRALGVIRGIYPSIRWRFVRLPVVDWTCRVERKRSKWQIRMTKPSANENRAVELCKSADQIWLAQSDTIKGHVEASRLHKIISGLAGKAAKIRRTHFDDLRAETLAAAFDLSSKPVQETGHVYVSQAAALRMLVDCLGSGLGASRATHLNDPIALSLVASHGRSNRPKYRPELVRQDGASVKIRFPGMSGPASRTKVRLSPMSALGALRWASGSGKVPVNEVPDAIQYLFDDGSLMSVEKAYRPDPSSEKDTKFAADRLVHAKSLLGADADIVDLEPDCGRLVPSTLVIQESVSIDTISSLQKAIVRRWVLSGLLLAEVSCKGDTFSVDLKVDSTKAAAIVDHVICGDLYSKDPVETAANLALYLLAYGSMPPARTPQQEDLDELTYAAEALARLGGGKARLASFMAVTRCAERASRNNVLAVVEPKVVEAEGRGAFALLDSVLSGSSLPLTESAFFAKLVGKDEA